MEGVDRMKKRDIEKEYIEEMFLFGCAGGKNVMDKFDAKVEECRVIGGYGNDVGNERRHKDLDILMVVGDASKLEGRKFRAFKAKGLGDKVLSKPVDLFVCDEEMCLKPITKGGGIKYQHLSRTDADIRDEGIKMKGY